MTLLFSTYNVCESEVHTVGLIVLYSIALSLYDLQNSKYSKYIEEFFSSRRWKVYDRQPYTRVNLLQAMDLACGDIGEESCQGWIRHTRGFFPRCLRRDNIACDVDEVLWPDPAQRQEAHWSHVYSSDFCPF